MSTLKTAIILSSSLAFFSTAVVLRIIVIKVKQTVRHGLFDQRNFYLVLLVNGWFFTFGFVFVSIFNPFLKIIEIIMNTTPVVPLMLCGWHSNESSLRVRNRSAKKSMLKTF